MTIRNVHCGKKRSVLFYPDEKADYDIDNIVVVKHHVFKTQMRLAALAFDILLDTGEYISVQTMKSADLKRDTIFIQNVRREAIYAL